MAMSDGEQAFCVQCIELDARLDGRSRTDYRPVELELGLIAQASGSARLHLGATDVLVGVKAEVGSPEQGRPNEGRLQVSVECSSCASPEYIGRGGEEWGSQLARALENSLRPPGSGKGGGLDLRPLHIISGKTCWVLYIDALVLNDDGNVLGALSLATRAALASTRIPKVEVVMGEGGEDPELELDDDPSSSTQLSVADVPVIVSISQVAAAFALDLSLKEECCAGTTLHVAVNSQSQLCGVTQEGPRGVDPSMMVAMLEKAQAHGAQLTRGLDHFLAEQARKAS
mmetsp:Transcript_24732/g.53946  ORF Transcript_24732/g.53946 Transcript_24732/m.53946 type:complete len:286 (+) Transcript_24732:43-900(+)